MGLKYLSGRCGGQGPLNIKVDLADGLNCLGTGYIAGYRDISRSKHWKMPHH